MTTTPTKGATSYFRGFKVRFTGKSETLYGGLFHVATYCEGPSKGDEVHVAARLV